MNHSRTLRLVLILAGLTVLGTAALYTWGEYTTHRINEMSRDLNPAERPEAYQALIEQVDKNITERQRERLNRKLEGETLTSRLKFSSRLLLDIAMAGGSFFAAVQGNGTDNTTKTGYYFARCPNMNGEDGCEDRRNIPVATHMAAGWMNLGTKMGGLDALWRNSTAVQRFNSYVERAEYYDARLRKGGFQLKPVELMHYTDNGIYIVGSLENNLTVDNTTIRPEKKGNLLHIDRKLGTGTHTVEASGQEFRFKVIHMMPGNGIEDGKLKIEGTENYEKAVLKGPHGRTKVRLSDENTTEIREIPAKSYTKEGLLENTTEYRPFTLKLVSPEVNTTLEKGSRKQEGPDPSTLYFFGMTPEEYDRTRELFRKISGLPLVNMDTEPSIPGTP